MSDGDFARLRAIIHEQTGITIGETRRSMLVSRLRKRLRALNLPDYKSYVARITKDPAERQELTNCVTTNETYFYRTPRVWTHFTETFVPGFLDRAPNRPLRVWSAASSTGEEAHTAGVLLEEIRSANNKLDYTITGTDVSSRVLKIATAGVYKGRPVERFRNEKADVFARHMVGDDEAGWKVAPDIARRIRFHQHNLLKPLMNTAPFDVIFLRNVLIYFTAEDQERILHNVRKVLDSQGILYIGESESLKHIRTDFVQLEPIMYVPASRAELPA